MATAWMAMCGRPLPAAVCQQSVLAFLGVHPALPTFVETVVWIRVGSPSALRRRAHIALWTAAPRTSSACDVHLSAVPVALLYGLVPASYDVVQSVATTV